MLVVYLLDELPPLVLLGSDLGSEESHGLLVWRASNTVSTSLKLLSLLLKLHDLRIRWHTCLYFVEDHVAASAGVACMAHVREHAEELLLYRLVDERVL